MCENKRKQWLTLVWPKQGHVCVSRPGNDDNDDDGDHADADDDDDGDPHADAYDDDDGDPRADADIGYLAALSEA